MQFGSDASLKEAVTSENRRLSVKLLFDWNRNGLFDHAYSDLSNLVISAELDKSMSGALPPGTPFVEGTAATELSLTLGGHRKASEPPANTIFSKYHPDSPLYNRDDIRSTPVEFYVQEQTDTGHFWVKQFTGWIRSAKTNADSGEVQITCLDAAQKLQDPIWLPAYAVGFGEQVPGGSWTDFSSHWVIDRVLRTNGYSTTPLPHPDAVYSATLHGGGAPEIGWTCYGNTVQEDSTYRWKGGGTEPMYLDAVGSGSCEHNGNTSRPIYTDAGNTIGVFQRVKHDPSGGSSFVAALNGAPFSSMELNADTYGDKRNTDAYLQLDIGTDGYVTFGAYNYFSTNNYAQGIGHSQYINDGLWHYIQAEVSFNTDSVTIRISIDDGGWAEQTFAGAFPKVAPVAGDPDALPWQPEFPYIEWPLSVQTSFAIGVSDIQVYETKTAKHKIYSSGWAPNAILDAGLNKLWAVPEFQEIPSWDILREIVSTEFGSLFVDEQGRVVFRNMDTSRASRTEPDLELSSDKISTVAIQDATDNVVNVITGTVQNYAITPGSAFDAARDSLYYDRSNSLNRQLEVDRDLNQFRIKDWDVYGITQFWPQVRGMVWPTTVGRNVVGFVTAASWGDGINIRQGISGVAYDGANNGSDLATTQNPTVDVWPYERNSLYIAVFNQNYTGTIQLSNGKIDTGNPEGAQSNNRTMRYCLKIAGAMLTEQREYPWRVDNPDSILEDGYLPYEIAKNPWTQTLSSMQNLANKLLDDMVLHPVPLIDDITAPMDQRVQLGDTLEIIDAGPLGGSLMTVITGINRRITDEGAVDQYSLKLIFRPASWILGDPNYSILGQTTYLNENVAN